ncbi:hypothetical protein OC195_01530 [Priestia flexa]|nr:hypothetical protein OC195_01530 [Priestia flexa]
MTGVLRFENPQDKQRERGFILTSLKQSGDKGDEGIYYVTKWFTIRLPINEHFTVWYRRQAYIKSKLVIKCGFLEFRFFQLITP